MRPSARIAALLVLPGLLLRLGGQLGTLAAVRLTAALLLLFLLWHFWRAARRHAAPTPVTELPPAPPDIGQDE